ncbi:MAG: hypothetical protein MUO27_10065 [Sedimentisphaerales bacterium]|nr:hypothetical protein [Sedimentisphaerales bacterium]
MIRFKCIYCGQRILAPDNGAGKKGHCPKCQHDLVVPKTTKGRPAISPDKEKIPEQPTPRIPAWETGSGFDRKDAEEVLIELYKESFSFLIPTYDELSLFLMSVTLIVLCLVNNQMRDLIKTLFVKGVEAETSPVLIPLVLFLGVLGLCFFHVFTRREKTVFEKRVMVGFAVLTNIVTGIIAGVYTLTNSVVADWLIVFPIWNVINGLVLLFMVFLKVIDEECISDRDASITEVIIGLIAVLVIFIFCNFVFKLYWAITFSICIIYTTSFDRAVQSVFPGIANREDEQDG